MIYPRVNLLKKSEQRYQGAVSRRFILISAVVAPILLIAILSGVKLIQYSGVKSELTTSRELWKDLEPKLTLFKDKNRGLVVNRNVLELFEGWNNSQASFVELLDDIQGTVPGQIQFTRLSVRSDSAEPVYTAADEMQLKFELVIEGRSQGELAENYVIDLQKDLLGREKIASTFDSIKLSSMRKRQSVSGESLREFRLEGRTAEVEADQ
jgi:hypothetical protein